MTATELNSRHQKGLTIAQLQGMVIRIDENTYKVKSQSSNSLYDVISTELGWSCSCPDFIYNKQKCKHAFGVEISLTLRKTVEVKRIEPIINTTNCIYCKSANIVKDGLRHNKYGDIQKYNCKDCSKYFTINVGFERMKSSPQIITSALQLYFTGESLRNTQKFLRLQGVSVNHNTIYRWIRKYVSLMEEYLSQIKPNVGDTWRADELWLKVKGNMKYLFALMDDETRFWIAQEVGDTKYKHDAGNLFRKGKEAIGRVPATLITDGLVSYHEAYKKEFFTKQTPRTQHIHTVKISGDRNNNKMERFNGEIRDREKVMRGLKKKDTPILTGYQIYHNYLRPHEGLNNMTPAEKCGIKIDGGNRWKTLIENASIKKEVI
jgi:putative transposase